MAHQCKNQTKTLENDRTSQATAKAKSTSPTALHPMLHLQRQVGNQAVGRLIQAKLTVGEPNDVYEQEADRVAADVVRQIHSPKIASTDQTASVQRQTVGDELEKLQTKPLIQRKSDMGGMAVSPEVESSIQQARGGGQSLAESIRTPMEQAFGADFSGVRVHTDDRSDRLNRSVGARAFTMGQDVFFRQGEYSPGSRGGQELLAHELTHVVQQTTDYVKFPGHDPGGLLHTPKITLQRMISPQKILDEIDSYLPVIWNTNANTELTNQRAWLINQINRMPPNTLSENALERLLGFAKRYGIKELKKLYVSEVIKSKIDNIQNELEKHLNQPGMLGDGHSNTAAAAESLGYIVSQGQQHFVRAKESEIILTKLMNDMEEFGMSNHLQYGRASTLLQDCVIALNNPVFYLKSKGFSEEEIQFFKKGEDISRNIFIGDFF